MRVPAQRLRALDSMPMTTLLTWVLLLAGVTRAQPPQSQPADSGPTEEQQPGSQQVPLPPKDLGAEEALAKLLDKTHRPETTATMHRAFDALLTVQTLARNQESVTVTATARYLRDNQGVRPREFLKLQLEEGAAKTLMGVDAAGPWMVINGRTQSLRGEERSGDRMRVFQQVAFARQLLLYTHPGNIVRQLEQPNGVTRKSVKTGRRPAVECLHLRGRLAQFPVYGGNNGQGAATSAPVELEIWVAEETGRLHMARSHLVGADGKVIEESGETFLFNDYSLLDGVLLPRSLTITPTPPKVPEGVVPPAPSPVRVMVSSIKLGPVIEARDVSRPR